MEYLQTMFGEYEVPSMCYQLNNIIFYYQCPIIGVAEIREIVPELMLVYPRMFKPEPQG